MPYLIDFKERANEDLTFFKNDKKNLKKINDLIESTIKNPRFGVGKPEILKHQDIETWSRRINLFHRMIYIIDDEQKIITIISLYGHYANK